MNVPLKLLLDSFYFINNWRKATQEGNYGGRHHAFADGLTRSLNCLAWPTDELPLQEWSSGFFDCCKTASTPSGEVGGFIFCCKAMWCPGMVLGDNSEYMSQSEGVCCAGEGKSSSACLLYCVAGQRVPEACL